MNPTRTFPKKRLSTFALLMLTTAAGAVAQAGGVSRATYLWIQKQNPSPAVYGEIAKFPDLTTEYVRQVPQSFSGLVMSDLERRFAPVLTHGTCVPRTDVEFLNSISSGPKDAAARNFESNVMHVQVLTCLEGVTAAQLAAAYTSAEFKARGVDTVVSSKKTGPRVCQVTHVPVLGNSVYCYNETTYQAPEAIYIHSYNDSNGENADAKIYFREMLTAVVDIQVNGHPGAAFYTNTYIRSENIPGFLRSIARGRVQSSQETSVRILESIAHKY
jgi:hypothetical protein